MKSAPHQPEQSSLLSRMAGLISVGKYFLLTQTESTPVIGTLPSGLLYLGLGDFFWVCAMKRAMQLARAIGRRKNVCFRGNNDNN
jgi:hypothetical protein